MNDTPDCYHNRLPGEPHFTLLARDPMFAKLVREWAEQREYEIACGMRPITDREQVISARMLAAEAVEWRRLNPRLWQQAAFWERQAKE